MESSQSCIIIPIPSGTEVRITQYLVLRNVVAETLVGAAAEIQELVK